MRTKHCGGNLRMNERGVRRILRTALRVMLGAALTATLALAQKPGPSPTPSPTPAPSPGPTGNPIGTPATIPNPLDAMGRTGDSRVMFLRGQVVATDGSKIPHDVLVERYCREQVIQQQYAGPGGDFSFELGARSETIIDASGDINTQEASSVNRGTMGIPRQMLMGCEIRASATGFVRGTVRLYDLPVGGGDVNVGNILIDRVGKTDNKPLNAAAYRAPKEAVKAYEKGISCARSQKYAEAETWFEKAVKIYPQYSRALYELGVMRQKTKDKDGAKAAFTQAAETDKKMMAPWLKLAEMAYTAQDWPEVLRLTQHIIELDPMGKADATGYVLDLDPVNSGEAYFYNAMANYQLGKVEAAEKSALKAEHVDLMTRFPQLHLLVAEIYSQKGNYGGAIAEMETYIELVPGAKDMEPVKTRLAKLEELNARAAAQKIENRN